MKNPLAILKEPDKKQDLINGIQKTIKQNKKDFDFCVAEQYFDLKSEFPYCFIMLLSTGVTRVGNRICGKNVSFGDVRFVFAKQIPLVKKTIQHYHGISEQWYWNKDEFNIEDFLSVFEGILNCTMSVTYYGSRRDKNWYRKHYGYTEEVVNLKNYFTEKELEKYKQVFFQLIKEHEEKYEKYKNYD